MSLSVASTAVSLNSVYDTLLVSNEDNFNTATFLNTLSIILDNGLQDATPSLPNIDITTVAGTLSIVESNNMLDSIADSVVNYWSAAVALSGTPVSCAAITSVSNNASTIKPLIKSSLLALTGSKVPVTPYYEGFVSAIYEASKTIVWTVDEADSKPCSSTFSVTLT